MGVMSECKAEAKTSKTTYAEGAEPKARRARSTRGVPETLETFEYMEDAQDVLESLEIGQGRGRLEAGTLELISTPRMHVPDTLAYMIRFVAAKDKFSYLITSSTTAGALQRLINDKRAEARAEAVKAASKKCSKRSVDAFMWFATYAERYGLDARTFAMCLELGHSALDVHSMVAADDWFLPAGIDNAEDRRAWYIELHAECTRRALGYVYDARKAAREHEAKAAEAEAAEAKAEHEAKAKEAAELAKAIEAELAKAEAVWMERFPMCAEAEAEAKAKEAEYRAKEAAKAEAAKAAEASAKEAQAKEAAKAKAEAEAAKAKEAKAKAKAEAKAS